MPSNNTSPVFFYTYILQSKKVGHSYIGFTENLRRRLEEHHRGKNFSTQYRLPIDLVYYEACLNEIDAKQRETYLKSTAGRRFLAKRLKNHRAETAWHRVK